MESGELERAVNMGLDDPLSPYVMPAVREALELTEPENRRLMLAYYQHRAS